MAARKRHELRRCGVAGYGMTIDDLRLFPPTLRGRAREGVAKTDSEIFPHDPPSPPTPPHKGEIITLTEHA